MVVRRALLSDFAHRLGDGLSEPEPYAHSAHSGRDAKLDASVQLASEVEQNPRRHAAVRHATAQGFLSPAAFRHLSVASFDKLLSIRHLKPSCKAGLLLRLPHHPRRRDVRPHARINAIAAFRDNALNSRQHGDHCSVFHLKAI